MHRWCKPCVLAVAGTLLLSTPAIAATPGNTVSESWSAQRIPYTDTGQVEQLTLVNELGIATSPLTPDIGDTVTVTATISMDSGNQNCTATSADWYVNGTAEQSETYTSSGTGTSVFKFTYTGPTSVYCTFDGYLLEGDPQSPTAYGEFERQRTECISIGASDAAAPGNGWAWDYDSCGSQATFTAPYSGDYDLTVIGCGGNTTADTIQLVKDTAYPSQLGSISDGSVTSFGDTVVEAGTKNSRNGLVLLTMKKIPIVINAQPAAESVDIGQAASFTVQADGGPDDVSYQWYRASSADGTDGTAIEKATESTYSIQSATTDLNGSFYYCKLSSKTDEAQTKPVALTVYGQPVTKPEIAAVTEDGTRLLDDEWTQGPVTVTITGDASISGAGTVAFKVSLDNGKTWADNYEPGKPITVDSSHEGTVEVIARAYNASSSNVYVESKQTFHIDASGPEITVDGIPSDWTNQDAVLKVTAKDSGAGLDTLPYSFDGGKTWAMTSIKTMEENGSVVVAVKDKVGNITKQTVVVDHIDKTLPSLRVTGNPSGWQDTAAVLTISASDEDAGLAQEPYSFDGGKTWTAEVNHEYTENQDVDIQVKDAAGNVAEKTVAVKYVDTEAPAVSVEGNPTDWVNTKQTMTIIAEEKENGSGLATRPYSWDGGKTWTSNPSKAIVQNGAYEVVVRDKVGNKGTYTLNVGFIDTTVPESFTVTGNPTEWTNQDVTLQITDAVDNQSGLAAEAYNWDNNGWTTENSLKVEQNAAVTISVRDKAGNVKTDTVVVGKIDKTAPLVAGISGNPTEWVSTAATITASATDSQSGLAAEAYSWDDGVTWQASPEEQFTSNQAVGLKVRDNVGNTVYYPFLITKVDAEPPELTVQYNGVSDDMKSVIVTLYATDSNSSAFYYCFNYDEAQPELAEWVSDNERPCESGQEITVAVKDDNGNVATKTITPSVYNSNGSGEFKLFSKTSLDVADYVLGGVGNETGDFYMDAAGMRHSYQNYIVGGRSVKALPVTIEAAPAGGGWLSGTATLNGNTYPIYWDKDTLSTKTNEGGTGTFYIEPDNFHSSSKSATLTVSLTEYETEDLDKELNTDTMMANLSIDVTAPVVNISLDNSTHLLSISAKDVIAGVETIQYQTETVNGLSEWFNYTGEVTLNSSCKVKVKAMDRVGNTSITNSQDIAIAGSIMDGNGYQDSYFYRTSLFNHYLIGTGTNNAAFGS